jgi:hypothetical protein
MKDNLKVNIVWLLALTALPLALGVVESVAAEPVTSAPVAARLRTKRQSRKSVPQPP